MAYTSREQVPRLATPSFSVARTPMVHVRARVEKKRVCSPCIFFCWVFTLTPNGPQRQEAQAVQGVQAGPAAVPVILDRRLGVLFRG